MFIRTSLGFIVNSDDISVIKSKCIENPIQSFYDIILVLKGGEEVLVDWFPKDEKSKAIERMNQIFDSLENKIDLSSTDVEKEILRF